MLERIVYCSRATVPTESLLVIAEILAVSQRNNDRDRLTGALAISDGWFLQVIEGEPMALDRLLRRLQGDPRHQDVEVLSRVAIDARLFGRWSMTAARITPALRPELIALIDACRVAPADAVAGLLRIVAAEAGAEETTAGAGV